MIFWILGNNALTGPIPSELGLLTALTGLYLRKSFVSLSTLLTCAITNILICLDDILDFSSERLDRSDPFRAWNAHGIDLFQLV